MKQKIKREITKRRNFLLYGIIGTFSLGIDFGTFALLYNGFKAHPVTANVIAVIIATTNSFILNVFFNFKTKNEITRRYSSFFIIAMCSLLISTAMIRVLGGGMGINLNIVKAGSLPIVALFQFVLNKKITFKK